MEILIFLGVMGGLLLALVIARRRRPRRSFLESLLISLRSIGFLLMIVSLLVIMQIPSTTNRQVANQFAWAGGVFAIGGMAIVITASVGLSRLRRRTRAETEAGHGH